MNIERSFERLFVGLWIGKELTGGCFGSDESYRLVFEFFVEIYLVSDSELFIYFQIASLQCIEENRYLDLYLNPEKTLRMLYVLFL